MDLQEWRDVVMIVFMICGIIAFLLIAIVTAVSGFLTWSALGRVRSILKHNVQPAAENVKATTQNIRGTISYISETAVKPVASAYGVAAGAKRFVGVVTKVRGNGKKKDGE